MTDSNLALMSKLDTLPTASVSSNYQDEDAASDMTKSVNAQIDENTKNLNRHFDHLLIQIQFLSEKYSNPLFRFHHKFPVMVPQTHQENQF